MMPKAHPIELRERVVAHVDAGHSHRETATHFRVSVKFVNDMIKLRRETSSLEAKPVGNNLGHGKLEPVKEQPWDGATLFSYVTSICLRAACTED